MNTLDDLRRTLDDHAHDTAGRGVDPSSLHVSIASAKRRRTATRGGLALAAVATVAAGAFLPNLLDGTGDVQPAAPVLLGSQAPDTKQALSLTYAYSDSEVSEDGDEVTLTPRWDDDADDNPNPLISWTTADPDATVTVTLEGITDDEDQVIWSSTVDAFDDHVVADAWTGEPITVSSSGPGVAAAIYTLDEEAPLEGDTNGEVTFLATEDGQGLIDSAFGEPGATFLRATLDVRGTHVFVGSFCSGFGEDVSVAISIDGEAQGSTGGCTDRGPIARTSGLQYEVPEGTTQVEVELRVTISLESDDLLAPRDDGRGLLAVQMRQDYANDEVAGQLVERWTEVAGHLWRTTQVLEESGVREVSADVVPGRPTLAEAVVALPGHAPGIDELTYRAQVRLDGKLASSTYGGTSSPDWHSTGPILVAPGTTTVTAGNTEGATPSRTGLVLWELAD